MIQKLKKILIEQRSNLKLNVIPFIGFFPNFTSAFQMTAGEYESAFICSFLIAFVSEEFSERDSQTWKYSETMPG